MDTKFASKVAPKVAPKEIITDFILWLAERENVVTLSKYHATDEVKKLIVEYLNKK